jgi:hypothetical protein
MEGNVDRQEAESQESDNEREEPAREDRGEPSVPILIPAVYADAHARDTQEPAPAAAKPAPAPSHAPARGREHSAIVRRPAAASSIAPSEIAARQQPQQPPASSRRWALPLALVALAAMVAVPLLQREPGPPSQPGAAATAPAAPPVAVPKSAAPSPQPLAAPEPQPTQPNELADRAPAAATGPGEPSEPAEPAEAPLAGAEPAEGPLAGAAPAQAPLAGAAPAQGPLAGAASASPDRERKPRVARARRPGRKAGGEANPIALPEQPSRGAIVKAMRSVHSAVRQCTGGRRGVAQLDLTLDGSGVVRHAIVGGQFKGTAEGSCIARAVRKARLSPFRRNTFRVLYPYSI